VVVRKKRLAIFIISSLEDLQAGLLVSSLEEPEKKPERAFCSLRILRKKNIKFTIR
jgi:hypothetical protein